MSASIHPSALVHTGARIGARVEIGPGAIVGEHVEIGDGTTVGAHAVLSGHTRIGRDNRIFPFCAVGGEPQDKKYAGEPTRLDIGDRNTIRECCTLNCGTVQDQSLTKVGNDNWIMAYVHVAHDCIVGNNTILANSVQLGGHVHVDDWAILGGLTGVHQFVRVGAHAMTAAGTILFQDLPPYVMASGNGAEAHGINTEGLRRRGFSDDGITAIRRAYKTLYKSGLRLEEAREAIAAEASAHPELAPLLAFISTAGRGIVR